MVLIFTHPQIISGMLDHADAILGWCREHDTEELSENPILHDGCVYNLWRIGQYAKHPTEAFMSEHAQIPWETIARYGSELYEGTERVDSERMLDYIREDLPVLREQLAALLDEITPTKG